MKILMSCYNLNLSGSSTFTYTLASELKRRGHEIHIYSIWNNEIGKILIKNDFSVFTDIGEATNNKYDFLMLQHNINALIVRAAFPDTPAAYICHGIIPELEAPPSVDININKFIAISEEVKKYLITEKKINKNKISIIRNFVDTKRFKMKHPINKNLRKVLYLSYHNAPLSLTKIKKACFLLNLELAITGQNKRIFNVENEINKADLVITLGRGALEAMACQRAVLIFDMEKGDEMITKNNYPQIRKNNFSGRYFKKKYNTDLLTEEIRKYTPDMGSVNREIILRHHDAAAGTLNIEKIMTNEIKNFKYIPIKLPLKELQWTLKQYQRLAKNTQKIRNSTSLSDKIASLFKNF